jgi:hypothetical protein
MQFPSWVPFYWRELLDSIVDLFNEEAGSDVNARAFISDDGTAIPPTALTALRNHMVAIAGGGGSVPPTTTRALNIFGGYYKFDTFQTLETWGIYSTIRGDRGATILDGLGLNIKDTKSDISGLSFVNTDDLPDTTAIRLTGAARRHSSVSSFNIDGYDVGVCAEDRSAWERVTDFAIQNCRVGYQVKQTLGEIVSDFIIQQCTEYGIELAGDGEPKFAQAIVRGSGITNLYAHGSGFRDSSGSTANTLYFTQCTFTGALTRAVPILSVQNNGGFAEIVCGAAIAADVTASPSIMFGGDVRHPARDHFQLFGTAGQLDSVEVDGEELLASVVPFATSLNQTATNIAANINTGTGTHGYIATASSSFVRITSPVPGTAFNALVLTTAASGGLTATPRGFITVTCATPHGYTSAAAPLALTEFDTAPYAGVMPIRYIVNTTTFITDCVHTLDVSGNIVTPHFFRPSLSQVRAVGTGFNVLLNITSITATSIVTDTPFADLSGIPVPGSNLTVPGWDVIIDADDINNVRVSDIDFIGCNINYTLILSGMSVEFVGTFTKCQFEIVTRANSAFQANGILIKPTPRGRGEDLNSAPVITGANTGWTQSGMDPGDTSAAGDGFYYIYTPNSTVPLVNGIAKRNGIRVYEDKIERIIADVVVATETTNELRIFAARMRRSTGTTPLAWFDMVANDTSVILNAQSDTLTNANLLLGALGTGAIQLTSPLRVPNTRAGNATLVGGTVTVANTTVTANTKILLTRMTAGGTPGELTYTKINTTSFTINSASGTDTSVVSWWLVESV